MAANYYYKNEVNNLLKIRDDRIEKLEKDMAQYVLGLYPTPNPTGFTFQSGWTGSGSFTDGQTVSITKGAGGLGAGPDARMYEDFESGIVGDRVGIDASSIFNEYSPNALALNTGATNFIFSNTVKRIGSKSGRAFWAVGDGYAPGIRCNLPSSRIGIYLSFSRYIDRGGSASTILTNNFKHAFASSAGVAEGDWLHATPSFIQTQLTGDYSGGHERFFDESTCLISGSSQAVTDFNLNSNNIDGVWTRFAFYARCSSVRNAADGARFIWINNWMEFKFDPEGASPEDPDPDAVATVDSSSEGTRINSFGLNIYMRFQDNGIVLDESQTPPYKIYYDDVYVGLGVNACSRLEITDAVSPDWNTIGPAFGSASMFTSEVQDSVNSWGDTTVSFNIKKKGFSSLSGKKLYILTGPRTAQFVGTFN